MNNIKTPLQLLFTIFIFITCIAVVLQDKDVLVGEFCKGIALVSIILLLKIISTESLTLK